MTDAQASALIGRVIVAAIVLAIVGLTAVLAFT